MPDFKIKFKCLDANVMEKDYTISYINNIFDPQLKTFTDPNNNETWVMVFKSLESTNEITLQLTGDSKIYNAKGFGLGEKRFIEISINSGGGFIVIDRDITSINKIILFE